MKDIKLCQRCMRCGDNLTLMESVNVNSDKRMLVKRCLNCGNHPVEEVCEIIENNPPKEEQIEFKTREDGKCIHCGEDDFELVGGKFFQDNYYETRQCNVCQGKYDVKNKLVLVRSQSQRTTAEIASLERDE